jgi:hypothetical protein
MSGTLYARGVGTSNESQVLATGTFSSSVTVGFGHNEGRPLNTFNSFSGTGVRNTYTNSFTLGQNYTFSTGRTSDGAGNRNQRTAFIGLTALNTLTIGIYNDVRASRAVLWGDGGDKYWSAGINVSLSHKGYTASWLTDMYYGNTEAKATYKEDIKDERGENYARQSLFDLMLNNAVESINVTFPRSDFGGRQVTLGLGRTGRAAMWPSYAMHRHQKEEGNTTKHFHFITVLFKTTAIGRVFIE